VESLISKYNKKNNKKQETNLWQLKFDKEWENMDHMWYKILNQKCLRKIKMKKNKINKKSSKNKKMISKTKITSIILNIPKRLK